MPNTFGIDTISFSLSLKYFLKFYISDFWGINLVVFFILVNYFRLLDMDQFLYLNVSMSLFFFIYWIGVRSLKINSYIYSLETLALVGIWRLQSLYKALWSLKIKEKMFCRIYLWVFFYIEWVLEFYSYIFPLES